MTKVIGTGGPATKMHELDPPADDKIIDGIRHIALSEHFEKGELNDIELYKLCTELDRKSTLNLFEQDDLGMYTVY